MHLGLYMGPFCPQSDAKFQITPSLRLFNILWVQEKGTQMCMSE